MRRPAAIATMVGGSLWAAWCCSVLATGLEVGPIPFATAAIPASLACLGLGSAGLVSTGTWGRGPAVRFGFAAVAIGGVLAAASFAIQQAVAFAIGLWLVLGGSVVVGSVLRRLGSVELDRGLRLTGMLLTATAVGLVGLAFLSSRGPVGIFNLDGYSTLSKFFALVELAFGASWIWLGWRALARLPIPTAPDDRRNGRPILVVAVVGSIVIGLIVVGAGFYWVDSTTGPAAPPVEARFEGIGGEEHHQIVFPGGDAAFAWDIRDCGAGVRPHDVLAIDLMRTYDEEHTPDPGPPWFLGGSQRRGFQVPQMIVGQEYRDGQPVAGTTSMRVDAGLWSLHVEMPGDCHWRVEVRSSDPS